MFKGISRNKSGQARNSFIAVVYALVYALLLLYSSSLSIKYAVAVVGASFLGTLLLYLFTKKNSIVTGFIFFMPVALGFCVMKGRLNPISYVQYGFEIFVSDIFLFGFCLLTIHSGMSRRNLFDIFHSGSKAGFFLMLWFLLAVLSVLQAVDRMGALIGILGFLRMLIVIWCVYTYIEKESDVYYIFKIFFIALLVQALIMFAQAVAKSPIIYIPGMSISGDVANGVYRPGGTMWHSSNYAKFFGTLMAPLLSFCFNDTFSRKQRFFYRFVFFVSIAALILTLSRAGLLSCLAILILFFYVLMRLRILSIEKIVRSAIVILLVFLVFGSLVWGFAGNQLLNRFTNDAHSFEARLPMCKVALNVIKHHPVFGVGVNNYVQVQQIYDTTREQISYNDPVAVHNIFLLYASEIGIVGALAFILFLLFTIYELLKIAKRTQARNHKLLFYSFVFAIVNLILQSMTGKGLGDHIVHLSLIGIIYACAMKWNRLSNSKYVKSCLIR